VERLLGSFDHGLFTESKHSWRQRVEALAQDVRTRLSAHPGAIPLLIGGPMNRPHALALNERLLEVLTETGLNATNEARAAYLVTAYVFGSIALEVADVHHPGPLPPEDERAATRQRALTATPTPQFPPHRRRGTNHRRDHELRRNARSQEGSGGLSPP
jgi:TetR/AcrR family transcriptional regulator, tetracycline repressor protein